ncbi:acyl-CoA dehydrogenase [Streptomyces sp. CB00455]|uniref:acyl-CoA dehydrogenase family protein n=1 Tax=Streptomyces sp. CB00455 TaxID=1703927 RepID=UPI00093ACE14|nr:acyl-CoA dehydrogenase [Streptomyces sp. CB00455]OKK14264.1 acyl-CoA dehydrogenase [Streptomyces sp. CB00455]
MKPPLGPELLALLHASAEKAAAAGEPDREALSALRASGLLATAVPRAHGGAGGDAAEINRVVADIAAADASVAIIAFQHFAVSARIAEWGTEEQRHRLLPPMADGSVLAASAWSENGSGAAKQNLASTGTRRADGRWLLRGSKTFTTGAAVADLYLVLVTTGAPGPAVRAAYGAAGQTFFLVGADNPGLVPDLGLDLAGMRGSATGLLALDGCVVGDEDRLGPEGHAASIIAGVRESGATLGAVSAGIAQAAFDLAVTHARSRGLLEMATVRHRLTGLATRLETVRAVVERAGARTAADPGLATLHSKLHATAAAEEICLDVARMLGSAGYRDGGAAGRLLADARGVGLMGPTNDLCRELVALQWTP